MQFEANPELPPGCPLTDQCGASQPTEEVSGTSPDGTYSADDVMHRGFKALLGITNDRLLHRTASYTYPEDSLAVPAMSESETNQTSSNSKSSKWSVIANGLLGEPRPFQNPTI